MTAYRPVSRSVHLRPSAIFVYTPTRANYEYSSPERSVRRHWLQEKIMLMKAATVVQVLQDLLQLLVVAAIILSFIVCFIACLITCDRCLTDNGATNNRIGWMRPRRSSVIRGLVTCAPAAAETVDTDEASGREQRQDASRDASPETPTEVRVLTCCYLGTVHAASKTTERRHRRCLQDNCNNRYTIGK